MPPIHHHTFTEKDENTLLEQFLKGDDEAFTILYNRFVNELLSYGKGLGFDNEILKDAIHDIFCKLYTDRKLIKNIQNLKSYLFRALKNHLLNDLQKEQHNATLEQNKTDFSIEVTVLDELIEEEERLLIQHTIEKFLNRLTERQKEAIYLRFIQEMEYEAIGLQLDMSAHAARKLISRAVIHIRKQKIPLPFLLLLLIKNG